MKKYRTVFVCVPRHVTALVLVVCFGHMILLLTWATNSVILDTGPVQTKPQIQMAGGIIRDDESLDGSARDTGYNNEDKDTIGYKSPDGSDRNIGYNKGVDAMDNVQKQTSYVPRQKLNGYISDLEYSKNKYKEVEIKEAMQQLKAGLLLKVIATDRRHMPSKGHSKTSTRHVLQYATIPGVHLLSQSKKPNETSAVKGSNNEIRESLWGVKSGGGDHQIAVKPKRHEIKRANVRGAVLVESPIAQQRDYQGSRRRGLSYPDDTAPPRGIKAPLQHTNTMSPLHHTDEIASSSETNGSKTRFHFSPRKKKKKLDTPAKQFVIGRSGGGGSSDIKEIPQKALAYSDMALRAFYTDKKEDMGINFQYSITPRFLCEPSEDAPNGVDMVTVIHSHPANKAQRDAIRSTWGRVARDYDRVNQIRLVFVLGIANGSAEREDLILREAKLYGDILVGVFEDSYENLSVKSLYAINWVAHHCISATYMLKTDDDTYLHLPALIRHLGMLNRSNHHSNFSVIGAVNTKSRVLRSGLWQVTMTSFPFEYYPQYCTGCAYILSVSILQELLSASRHAALIPIEDAYITGILVTLIGHTCMNLEQLPQWFIGPSHSNICKLIKGTLLGLHNVPYEAMYTVHKHVTARNYTICPS